MPVLRDLLTSLSGDLSFRILSGVVVDRHSAGSRAEVAIDGVTPNAFQLFPSRFLSTDLGNDVLCIDYDMGSGKTLSAALALTRLLSDTLTLETELRRSGEADLIGKLPRPYIVGNWSTVEAFEDELIRPLFGFVSPTEYADLLLARDSDEEHYEKLRTEYSKRVHRLVRMTSYQKLFNRYFRNAASLAVKDEKALLAAMERGDVVVDPTIVLELSNSVIVVDELQLLYSASGWNSYGVLLDHIRQNPSVHGLTTILLSGTFINSSPIEMVLLYNLIRDRGAPRREVSEFFKKDDAAGQNAVFRPLPAKSDELIRLFDGMVASYRVSPSKDFPTVILEGELLRVGGSRFKWLKLHQCHASPYQWEQYLASYAEQPTQQVRTRASFVLAAPTAEEEESPDSESPTASWVEEEIFAHDFAPPPKEEWQAFKVMPVRGALETYSGSWLSVTNLERKFGAIPSEFIHLLLNIVKERTGEKVVAHHRRLERGGLLQYAEALKENGFTPFGENPHDNAICIVCGEGIESHTSIITTKQKRALEDGEESSLHESSLHESSLHETAPDGESTSVHRSRESTDVHNDSTGAHSPSGGTNGLQSKVSEPRAIPTTTKDHQFIPAVFALLTGRSSFSERQRIIQVYNSSSNVGNSRILCLLLSGVGERGITLRATNYGVALDVFPGLPSWRQFISRIARHGTHVDLPPERRWTKIYTMVLSHPSERSDRSSKRGVLPQEDDSEALQGSGGVNEGSRDEMRYLFREINDEMSTDLWDRVRRRSITCPFIDESNRGVQSHSGTKREGCDLLTSKGEMSGVRGRSLTNHGRFITFYQLLHISFVKRVIRSCLARTPIWTLPTLRSTILSDSIRIVPHDMSYTTDEMICQAIVGLCRERECRMMTVGSKRDLTVLSASSLHKEDILLTVEPTRGGPLVFSLLRGTADGMKRMGREDQFSSIEAQSRTGVRVTPEVAIEGRHWVPIGQRAPENLQGVIDRIADISGYREKCSFFDRIIGKPGLTEVIRTDFINEGPIYHLLFKTNCIVWEGDDESHLKFARNRLRVIAATAQSHNHSPSSQVNPSRDGVKGRIEDQPGAVVRSLSLNGVEAPAMPGVRATSSTTIKTREEKLPKAIGYILGPEAHIRGTRGWSRISLPSLDPPKEEQWEICAIFSSGTAVAHGRWHTRVKIRPRPKSVEDQRKIQTGMACLSLTDAQIESYSKLLHLSVSGGEGKTPLCTRIEAELLKRQLAPEGRKHRYIYTPFEDPQSRTKPVFEPPALPGPQSRTKTVFVPSALSWSQTQ